MALIFYGKHSIQWMKVLNNTLMNKTLKNYVNTINNIYSINCIKKYKSTYIQNCYIIPLMEKHMIELYSHYDINQMKILMPSLDIINTFMCKKKFSEYIENNMLSSYTPITYKNNKDICNHIIIKPLNLNNGSGMMIIKHDINNIYDYTNYIVQEYIENNTEYCAYIVAKKGKIILCITYIYIHKEVYHIKTSTGFVNNILSQNNILTQGVINIEPNEPILYKINLERKYIDDLEKLLLPCQYDGICNIDFTIICNNIKVFEINPRLGGALMKFKSDLIKVIVVAITNYNN